MTNIFAAILILLGLLLFCCICGAIMLLVLIWRIAREFERAAG